MLNEKLKIQLEERDKSITTLQTNLASLESRIKDYESPETDTARNAREETDAIHLALRNIAEAVINDADCTRLDEDGVEEVSVQRSVSPYRARSISPTGRTRSPVARNRSPSPMARSRSPAFADATYSAVQAALGKRQMQVKYPNKSSCFQLDGCSFPV